MKFRGGKNNMVDSLLSTPINIVASTDSSADLLSIRSILIREAGGEKVDFGWKKFYSQR